MNLAVSAVLLFSAATTALFGWLVYRGDATLVSGYDPDRVTDEEGLTRFVGRWVLLLAGLTAAFGIGAAFVTPTLPAVAGYVALTLVVAVRVAVGTRRYGG